MLQPSANLHIVCLRVAIDLRTIRVLSPIGESKSAPIPLARRSERISKGTVGLLSNGKPNASNLLEAFGRRLQERDPSIQITLVNKAVVGKGSGDPAPLEVIEGLSTGAIAVLAASGD